MLGFDSGLAGVFVRHSRRARLVVVHRDLAGGAIAAPDERMRDAAVQLAQAVARHGVNEHRGDAVMSEPEPAGFSLRPWSHEASGDRLAHGETNGRLAAGAGVDDEADVEVASQNCRGGKNGLAARGKAREPLRDEWFDAGREAKLRYRTPFPSLPGVPERSLLDERADELRQEEGIALGVAIDEREELTPDFLFVERRRQPLLDLVAGETREHEFAVQLVPLERLPPLGRFGKLALVAAGDADEQALRVELPHDVLESVPRRAVGPLHLVEDDDDWPSKRRRSHVAEQFLKQSILTARCLMRRVGTKARDELVKLAPLALRRL